MAKKRIDPQDEEQLIDYENVEPEAVEENDDMSDIPGDQNASPYRVSLAFDERTGTVPQPDERTYRVSFALPYGVLVALLESEHPEADIEGAEQLGLLTAYLRTPQPTELGKLVINGFDQTAVRHKMLHAYRAAHNAEVDSDKTGFKRAE